MAENKKGFINQVKDVLDKLSTSQKIFLTSVIILSIVGIMLIVNVANSFNYGILFSNLSQQDSGKIIEKLKERKISYKIEGAGSIIKVPEDKKDELRIELASQGLPEGGGVGFEIFDKASISSTDFVQKINYVRAIEGSLARTISSLNEVISATVHIVLPKRSVFIEEQENAKASIAIKLRPGAMLSRTIVPAIIHLTAQAVEGLSPNDIAVIDMNGGVLLSKPRSGALDQFDELSMNQLSYQKKLEKTLENKVKNQLEPIIGAGKVKPNVTLELDFDKIETNEHKVDPTGKVIISEVTQSSKSTGGSSNGGVPGTSSNVVQSATQVNKQLNASKPKQAKTNKSQTNYDVYQKKIHLVKAIGTIKRMSVAVTIDNILKISAEGKETTTPLNQQQIQEIKALVQAAVGYDKSRGDIVTIFNKEFNNADALKYNEAVKTAKSQELTDKLTKYGTYFIVFLLIFFFIIRPMIKKVNGVIKVIVSPKADELQMPNIDLEKNSALKAAREEKEIEQEINEKYKVSKETKKMDIVKEKVREFAQGNIEGTASLIKNFIIEE